jgi:mRNA interferase MazF
LSRPSFAKCEDVRSIATERLIRRLGTVSEETMRAVEPRLCLLLGL